MRNCRAAGEFMKSSFRKGVPVLILLSGIFSTLPVLFCETTIFALSPQPHFLLARRFEPWEIPRSRWDERLLRNHAPYLVEGKGGLSLLLGEREEKLLATWGMPDRRSYSNPERLYYLAPTFQGSYLLYHGRIISIRFNIRKNLPESLQWQTALGLRHEYLENLEVRDSISKIKEFYKGVETIEFSNHIVIYGKGIGFHFHQGKLNYVEIFKPTREYQPFR